LPGQIALSEGCPSRGKGCPHSFAMVIGGKFWRVRAYHHVLDNGAESAVPNDLGLIELPMMVDLEPIPGVGEDGFSPAVPANDSPGSHSASPAGKK
jgi:hypothetical protein